MWMWTASRPSSPSWNASSSDLSGLSPTFPEGGSPFQAGVRLFVVEGYSFLYEYHPESNEVHVLEMKAPGIDWR